MSCQSTKFSSLHFTFAQAMYPLEKSIIQHEYHELKKIAQKSPNGLVSPTVEMFNKDLDQATQWIRHGDIVGNAPHRVESLLKRIEEARNQPLPDAATWYASRNLSSTLMMKSEYAYAKINIDKLSPLVNTLASILATWDENTLLPVYYLDKDWLATPRYEGLSTPEINREIVACWMFDLRGPLIFAVTTLENESEYHMENRRYHLLMDNGGSGKIKVNKDGSGSHTSIVPGNTIEVVQENIALLESLIENYKDKDDTLEIIYGIHKDIADVEHKLEFAIKSLQA